MDLTSPTLSTISATATVDAGFRSRTQILEDTSDLVRAQ